MVKWEDSQMKLEPTLPNSHRCPLLLVHSRKARGTKRNDLNLPIEDQKKPLGGSQLKTQTWETRRRQEMTSEDLEGYVRRIDEHITTLIQVARRELQTGYMITGFCILTVFTWVTLLYVSERYMRFYARSLYEGMVCLLAGIVLFILLEVCLWGNRYKRIYESVITDEEFRQLYEVVQHSPMFWEKWSTYFQTEMCRCRKSAKSRSIQSHTLLQPAGPYYLLARYYLRLSTKVDLVEAFIQFVSQRGSQAEIDYIELCDLYDALSAMLNEYVVGRVRFSKSQLKRLKGEMKKVRDEIAIRLRARLSQERMRALEPQELLREASHGSAARGELLRSVGLGKREDKELLLPVKKRGEGDEEG
jgi:uncharacterized protein YdcH (DUF465 family)